MRLFVFRHGETDHNRDGVTQGREDVPLNELGRRQAEAICQRYELHPFVAIYSSPLQRARETCAPLAARLQLSVTEEPDLAEMDVGLLGALSSTDLQERHAEFLEEWLGPGAPDARMPEGETLREVQDRAWAVVERAAAANDHGDAALFTHNFVTLTLLCRALSLDLSQFRRVRQDLGAVSILAHSQGTWRIETMNERCHLAGVESHPAWKR